MKHKYTLLLVFLNLFCFGKDLNKDIEGIYKDEFNFEQIRISNDSLFFELTPEARIYQHWDCPFAVCSIKQIDKNFYSLNTIAGSSLDAFDGMKITRVHSSKDSLDMSFEMRINIPNTDYKLEFTVEYCNKSYRGLSKDGACNLIIDETEGKNEPTDCLLSFRMPTLYCGYNDWQCFGAVVYNHSFELNKQQCEDIEIELPSVTNCTFAQYLLVNKYIYIKRGKIYWDGIKYYKRH